MTEEAAAAVVKALEPSLQRMQGQMEKVKMFKQVLGVSAARCLGLSMADIMLQANQTSAIAMADSHMIILTAGP